MKKKTNMIIQIAATYTGTVVGAGFASGQSIMQFFTVYGAYGVLGILCSTFLFVWIGTKMMILAHQIKAFSYQEFNVYLFGKSFGKVANALTFIILFGVTAVMLSGTGTIFEEQLRLPYQLGIIISIILCYLVMTKEISGIMFVNSLVVPMMLFFTILLVVKVVRIDNIFDIVGWQNQQLYNLKWFVSPFVYAGLNFAFILAVMVPLGSEVDDESALKWGGFWGGIGLGFMLLVSHFAMSSKMPEILQYDIPMAEIIRDFGRYFHVLFLLVIYGEIFTTLIGNVFGISRQIQSLYNLPKSWLVLGILLASFLISQAGFTSLNKLMFSPFFSLFRMFSSLTHEALEDNI